MKILCIGGTKFVGRQFVEDALSAGHEVTILQRGKTNQDIFPEVPRLIGDRRNIHDVVDPSSHFDLVLDTCGYHPEIVRSSCEFLKHRTSLYVFISTCSVYQDSAVKGLSESSPLATLDALPPAEAPIVGETYGPLKALCEEEVRRIFSPENYLILRPCIIVGPYDESGRFDRLVELLLASEMTVPDDTKAMIQFVDVRALSQFILKAANEEIRGTYNTIGPKSSLRFLDFIERAAAVLNPSLLIHRHAPGSLDFPMYVHDPKYAGFFSFDGSKAYREGFPDLALEQTLMATKDFLNSRSKK